MPRRGISGRQHLPVFVSVMVVAAVAMLPPAAVALIEGDLVSARAFFYGAILLGLLAAMIGIVTRATLMRENARGQLLTLLLVYALLPLMLAVPHQQSVGHGGLGTAWFEMVSAITTTGGTLHDHWQVVPRAAHLWRAEVAWLGGFFTWVTAAAVLAPMNLGGFEVRAPASREASARAYAQVARLADPVERLWRFARSLAPVYAGLTFALWLGLLIAGEDELIALCHAMSVLATSGISPVGGLENAHAGLMGEVLMAVFFVFALSRTTFARTILGDDRTTVATDPEIRLGLALIAITTLVLFARHWIGAGGETETGGQGWRALWGAVFTVASFLTTTGFESAGWSTAEIWSGLETPGLALVGLAVIGGGVATTAGGVKLMRIYALGHHMKREVEKLILPNSVGGGGQRLRRIRRQGAFIAWIMFMLFALSVAAVMVLLSLTGVQFETAMVLTVAALANCGPLTMVAAEIPLSFSEVPAASQVILGVAMVAGRLESLAIIALFNPEIWRR